ncbi:hypothetical protein DYI25_04100 [Mesobacillus boroniphilus]|uniref:Uncharacterized protein n=1 Tax=Mesobacillus boroniphilus TaxID=308892 RepID=A0A944CI47_9BACI|nr:hypothetical protein [Mesobacillus boroniphilus]MBS8263625.1 hypothetical protein [Mesobacillus boroniphilus]
MDYDSFFIDYIFMSVVILYSIYHLFISKSDLEEDITENMKARSIANVIRYLMFLAFNCSFAQLVFDIDWLLWISFFSVIALWILLVEHKFNFSYYIFISLLFLVFLVVGVPTHNHSFLDYISDQTEYECLRIECVKVSEVVVEDELKTEIKIFSIQDYSYDWYLLYGKGALTLKDEVGNVKKFSGINIGGLWLLDK